MKKLGVCVVLLVLCLQLAAVPAQAASYIPPFDLSAGSAYLVNLDSGMVIYEKNAQARVEPSDFAKLMTVVLALEEVDNPSEVTVSMKTYIQDEMYRRRIELGSIRLAGLYKGEELSVQSLLYAVMLPSANEAAMMIADHLGDGSIPYFVERMNRRAEQLGMADTHFTSPHGLPDPEGYTTAHDIFLLAGHAMSLPGFAELVGTTYYNGGPTNLQETLHWNTTNRLLAPSSPYYNGAVEGIKEAYHPGLGSGVVSMAKRDGYRYVAVLMGCSSIDETGRDTSSTAAFEETNRLYGWAFDTFRVKTLLEKGKSFGEVGLRLCWGRDFLRVMSAESFTALIPDAIEASSIRYELSLPAYVKAPVEKGELIGEVRLILADEQIGRVGVVSAESAEASRALLLLDRLAALAGTFWFKFMLVLLLVLIILYVALMIVRNRNRRRYRRRTPRD
jgi:D-alanyl-D-alanine carboxypeptidase (penicillin-binding protein 5/6)